MHMGLLGRMAAIVAIAVLCSAGIAQASIFVDLVSVNSNGSGGFTWTYNAQLQPAQLVQAGPGTAPGATTFSSNPNPGSGAFFADYFTIYDFAGFIPGSAAHPGGWSSQTLLIGATPTQFLALLDDSLLTNLTWYRSGGNNLSGPTDLGNFSADSTFSFRKLEDVSADATVLGGPSDGSAVANTDRVEVPTTAVPEPATLLLVGGGLLGLSLYRRRTL